MHELLTLIIHKQKKLGMSDYEFVRYLRVHSQAHISRQLWLTIRNGQRQISLRLLRAISQTFPELDMAILAYLKDTNETD